MEWRGGEGSRQRIGKTEKGKIRKTADTRTTGDDY